MEGASIEWSKVKERTAGKVRAERMKLLLARLGGLLTKKKRDVKCRRSQDSGGRLNFEEACAKKH